MHMTKTIPWRDRIIPEPNSGCLLWEGVYTGSGYGQITRNRKHIMVHRLAWEEEHGPIPPGLSVLHRCDVKGCVNVEHLFLGTHADNMRDMLAKGRQGDTAAHFRALTYCKHGHPFTTENTRYRRNGCRQCRKCHRIRALRAYHAGDA